MKRDRDRARTRADGGDVNIDEANTPAPTAAPKPPHDDDVRMRALESYYLRKKKREKN